jgi:hypothetical protein
MVGIIGQFSMSHVDDSKKRPVLFFSISRISGVGRMTVSNRWNTFYIRCKRKPECPVPK